MSIAYLNMYLLSKTLPKLKHTSFVFKIACLLHINFNPVMEFYKTESHLGGTGNFGSSQSPSTSLLGCFVSLSKWAALSLVKVVSALCPTYSWISYQLLL